MYVFTPCAHDTCNRVSLTNELFCAEHHPAAEAYLAKTIKTIEAVGVIKDLNLSALRLKDLKLTNRQFYGCTFSNAIFEKADLSGSLFRMCFFDFCQFADSTLSGIDAQFCSFAGSRMIHTNFSNSELVHNNFNGIDAEHCDFSNSGLYNSRFIHATFSDSDFIDCDLKKAYFIDIVQTNVSWKFSNTQEAYFKLEGAEF